MRKDRIASLALVEPIWIAMLGIPILMPGKFIPLQYHPLLIAGLFVFWPLRWMLQGSISRRSPLDWSLVALLLSLPLSIWASIERDISVIAAGYFLFGVTVFIAMINWPFAQRKPQLAAWLLLAIGGALAVLSPIITDWKPELRLFDSPLYEQMQRLPVGLGETIHANILAGALVVVLPLYVALAIRPEPAVANSHGKPWRPWVIRLITGMLALVLLGVLLLTQSRSGYVAAAVTLPLVFVFRWPKSIYLAPLLLAIAYLIVHFFGAETVLAQLGTDGSLDGWSGRFEIWTQSVGAVRDFVISGIGIGTFSLIIPLLYPLSISISEYPHAHNLFLQIGLDLGVPGLIAYLALTINLFLMSIVCIRQLRNQVHPSLGTESDTSLWPALSRGAMCGLTAMLIHGIFDVVVWGTKLSFVSWILFSLITLLFAKTVSWPNSSKSAIQQIGCD